MDPAIPVNLTLPAPAQGVYKGQKNRMFTLTLLYYVVILK